MATTLRADAQRNLDRILEAAAELYAEVGPDVSIDEIARRAGVGHGTVFRRFPTKDALRSAVIRAHLGEMLNEVRAMVDAPDAGKAFVRVVWMAAERCRKDRALFEGIERCSMDPDVAAAKDELHDTFDKIIRRAVKSGAVRRGLDARDVGALVGAAIQATAHAERGDDWRRYVQVVLDGLKPRG
ncbi:MAG TPA: helix-turn-helix domain-containing protein [Gaiellaceae bacterium]|nr:helix-turn-helix domain-containing protein [Gaiellaceae bacterium]